METCDVVVAGGGLGGLATAAMLAKGGRRVVLVERAGHLGGRARTSDEHGFHLNFGPHALYRGGPAEEVLKALGATPSAKAPRFPEACAVRDGKLSALPTSVSGLLSASSLTWRERLELARFFTAVSLARPESYDAIPLATWLADRARSPRIHEIAAAFLRIASYSDDRVLMSAGGALRQLQRALRPGVAYVDHGWGSLVEAMTRIATGAGAVLLTGAGAKRVIPQENGWIVEAGDRSWSAEACVVAAGPQVAAGLVEGQAKAVLESWNARARPIHAACLDLALSALPFPNRGFATGLDQPLYFAVHTMGARLAPEGVAVVHAAKYLNNEGSPHADEAEIEGFLDVVQPGWRDRVLQRRFLPRMTVSHALVEAARGGQAGRPGPAVPGARGLYVVGDWVGPDGQLLDAVLASARRASELILRSARREAA